MAKAGKLPRALLKVALLHPQLLGTVSWVQTPWCALHVAAPQQLQVGAPTPVGPAVLAGD